jgi:hypothetical protein
MKKNMQFYDIFYGLSPNYFFNVKFDKLDGAMGSFANNSLSGYLRSIINNQECGIT